MYADPRGEMGGGLLSGECEGSLFGDSMFGAVRSGGGPKSRLQICRCVNGGGRGALRELRSSTSPPPQVNLRRLEESHIFIVVPVTADGGLALQVPGGPPVPLKGKGMGNTLPPP